MALFGRPGPQDDRRAERYADWLQRRNPYAVGSLVLGIFSLIEFGALFIFGLAGIALGVVALVQLKRGAQASRAVPCGEGATDEPGGSSVPRTHGHVLAIVGIIFSVLSLIIAGLLYFRIVGG